jgi:hypothetical protein
MMGVSVYVFSYRCGFQGQYLIKSDVIPGFHVYRSDAESLAEDSLLLLAVAIGSLLCGAYIWVRTSIVKDVRAELDSLPHLFIVSLICAVGWGVSFLSDPYHFYSANGYFIVLLTAYFLTYKALRARDRILAFPFAQNLTTGLIGGSQ